MTRLLERMPTFNDTTLSTPLVGDSLSLSNQGQGQPPCIFATKLQAVLIASDCNPRWLCKHLLILASCKNVPLIHVKDKKEGSLRLGELVNVKTAIAVGIKAKESGINRFVQRVLHHDKLIGELDA